MIPATPFHPRKGVIFRVKSAEKQNPYPICLICSRIYGIMMY